MNVPHPITSSEPPKYFYLLDILRGLAALSVVLWHWQHFYTSNGVLNNFDKSQQPLYSYFFIFYETGSAAVDVFFIISGFVFFILYAEKISLRKISPKSFFYLRFSRLYPLHFLTLILVLFLGHLAYVRTGVSFVYLSNDLYHFVLNLLFAQSWGIEKGSSFNGPSWSVSVEILLYFVFFVLCWYRFNRLYILLLIVASSVLIQAVYAPIGRGLHSFFIGGVMYYIYLNILKNHRASQCLKIVQILVILSVVFMVAESKYSFCEMLGLKLLNLIGFNHNNDLLINKVMSLGLRTIIFPLMLFYLILLETVKGARGKNLAFIGHISYSSYLIHFPLQLILILVVKKLDIEVIPFFNSPITLFGFFIVLISLSLISFYKFELPMQNILRKLLIRPKQGPSK